MKTNSQIEFGDFQTPLTLATEVCQLLRRAGEAPDFVLEPTCGRGAFLVAAAEAFPQAILRGWDINPEYVREAEAQLRALGAPSRG